jgi:pimeloyl-ACP methyl ester carboxylesterase
VERSFLASDGLRLVFDVFGAPTTRSPAVCVPGLTRNARDFAELTSRLAKDRLAVSVDLRGRGRSDRDPAAQSYTPGVYADDMVQLCDALELDRAVWIGTSLGGLVAMHVGALAPNRVAGIVLNDIGPELDPRGLARIQSYAVQQGAVTTWLEAVAQVRAVSEFQTPGLSDEQWLHQAHQRYRELPDGRIVADYDPAVVSGPPSELDPWWVFERLADIPLLVLRGEFSDLLSAETVQTMGIIHPGMRAVEVPQRGHAPMLNEPTAAVAVDAFLADVDRIVEAQG